MNTRCKLFTNSIWRKIKIKTRKQKLGHDITPNYQNNYQQTNFFSHIDCTLAFGSALMCAFTCISFTWTS